MKRDIYIWFYLLVFLLGLTGCSKYQDTPHDLSGNNYIGGTVNLYNDYSADGLITPLVNQAVMVTDASLPPPNFLFSVYSDSSGGFVLPNLRNGVMYTIFSYDTIGGVLFSDTLQRMLTNDETPIQGVQLNLSVNTAQQNGIVFTVVDAQGNVVPGDTVLVYSSALLASYPGATDTCEGCNVQVVTNAVGKASTFNLAAGPYTAYFTLELDKQTVIWKGTYLFQLGATGVVSQTVTVQ
jgi:hypothetical protein